MKYLKPLQTLDLSTFLHTLSFYKVLQVSPGAVREKQHYKHIVTTKVTTLVTTWLPLGYHCYHYYYCK